MTRPCTTALLLAALLGGCVSHHVESDPIEIRPIHITMDINVKVQRELEEFFDFEEGPDAEPPTDVRDAAGTRPATGVSGNPEKPAQEGTRR